MEEQKNVSFFRFEDLRVYHKSLEYYKWVCSQLKSADELALKTLLMPLSDVALRISVNIAEGSSKYKLQFIEYLKESKSNVRQCVVLTTIANQNSIFTDEQAEYSRTVLIEMTKMLGAMVVSLQKDRRKSVSDKSADRETLSNADDEPAFNIDADDSDFNFNY